MFLWKLVGFMKISHKSTLSVYDKFDIEPIFLIIQPTHKTIKFLKSYGLP